MSRGATKKRKKQIDPDKKYGSILMSKFINYLMLNGKKSIAEQIVYEALEVSSKELKMEPMEVFETMIKNVGPLVEVKGKRIGGANYQVPVEVGKDRKNTLAMRWVLIAANKKKGQKMALKLSGELVQACHNEGAAIKKREETHKMAEANKAFAHFARF